MKNPFITLITVAALASLYSAAWFYTAGLIRDQLHVFYDDAAQANIKIEGDFPTVGGFPGPHKVHFSGMLMQDGDTLYLPDLTVTGLFLPGFTLSVDLPSGISLNNDPFWSLDGLSFDGRIPKPVPEDLTIEDLTAWRNAGDVLAIKSFEARKNTMILTGSATMILDDALQPAGDATLRLSGYVDLIHVLKTHGTLNDRKATFATMILTGLSRTDPKTNESYVEAPIMLRSRTLYVGPLAVLSLPEIAWISKHPPPAPPR